MILFGKIINVISLEEILYLLNIDNYDKDLKTFQYDFLHINNTHLDIKGPFKDFNKIKNFKNYKEIKNISIIVKKSLKQNSLKNITIQVPERRNCVLGTHRKVKTQLINDFFINYHKIK